MTTHEFYHVYSIPHKILMCVDLPSIETKKKGATKKEMEHVKQRNKDIAKNLEQKIKEAEERRLKKKSKE